MKAVIAYMPVIHAGHLPFFERHKPDVLLLMGKTLTAELPRLERDMRALPPESIAVSAVAIGLVPKAEVIEADSLKTINADLIVMPDEDISRAVAEKYLQGRGVEYDSVFLRWHQMNSITKLPPAADAAVSKEEFDREIMSVAADEAIKSSDWWRQIGAVLVKDGKPVLSGHNAHMPTERAPYINGDPRSNFDAGQQPDIYTSVHAEAGVVAEAAKRGVSLDGAALYVTTFPCPNCAKLLSHTGIRNIYYRDGYSVLDAEMVLKAAGVKLVRVE